MRPYWTKSDIHCTSTFIFGFQLGGLAVSDIYRYNSKTINYVTHESNCTFSYSLIKVLERKTLVLFLLKNNHVPQVGLYWTFYERVVVLKERHYKCMQVNFGLWSVLYICQFSVCGHQNCAARRFTSPVHWLYKVDCRY